MYCLPNAAHGLMKQRNEFFLENHCDFKKDSLPDARPSDNQKGTREPHAKSGVAR